MAGSTLESLADSLSIGRGSVKGCLLLQLLQGCPLKLQEELDEILEDELGKPRQAPRKGSEVGPSDSISAQGWRCSERAWLWSKQ